MKTAIPDELFNKIIEEHGTLDCRSHPRIGDLRPSKEDQEFLNLLIWQEESVIIEPTQDTMIFTKYGAKSKNPTEDGHGAAYFSALLFMEGD